MSGHNKWSTIKHKKAATDAKRGKIFSKIAKEIMVVARTGGGDPDANITLRALIQKARSANMPADNVERAIKKGTGEIEGGIFEELTYEGYAPGGVAVLVDVLTDNKNRSAAEVRHLFTKYNGSLSAQGSVSRLFDRKGQIIVASDAVDEDRLMELVLEAGAEDMISAEDHYEILTDPVEFMNVVDVLNTAAIEMANSEITMMPQNGVSVTDRGQASSLLKFMGGLEDLEDVRGVYSNADINDELMQELEE